MIFGTVGTMSVGIGIMEMGAGQLTELNCRRSAQRSDVPSITCTRTITTGIKREAPLEINNISGAEIQQVGRKFRNAYRVILTTPQGTIPVTEDFKSDEREKDEHAEQINTFIRSNSDQTLEILEDDRAQSNLFGLMFISTGLLWVLMAWVVQFSVHRKIILKKTPVTPDWDN